MLAILQTYFNIFCKHIYNFLRTSGYNYHPCTYCAHGRPTIHYFLCSTRTPNCLSYCVPCLSTYTSSFKVVQVFYRLAAHSHYSVTCGNSGGRRFQPLFTAVFMTRKWLIAGHRSASRRNAVVELRSNGTVLTVLCLSVSLYFIASLCQVIYQSVC